MIEQIIEYLTTIWKNSAVYVSNHRPCTSHIHIYISLVNLSDIIWCSDTYIIH